MLTLQPDHAPDLFEEVNHCHGLGTKGHPCDQDAFVPIPKLQRRVPRTAADAAHVFASGYVKTAKALDRAHGYDIGMQAFRYGYERDYEGSEKNWLKRLKGAVERARPEVVQAVEDAIAWNTQNAPKFMRVVERYGPDGVVVAAGIDKEGSSAGYDVLGSDAQARRIGAVTLVLDHEIWTDPKALAVRNAPAPGDVTAETFGGAAAMLRHEYGHYVWENMPKGYIQSWRDRLPQSSDGGRAEYASLQQHLTYYSGENEREAFSEAFAIWTDPKYNRSKYSAPALPLLDWMQEKFGGRTLERA